MEVGAIGAAEFYDSVRRCGAQEASDEAIRAAYLSFLEGVPVYKLRMVRALRECGLRTFALSNMNEIAFADVRERLFTADGLRFEDYFERAYISCRMQAVKPNPEIYRMMIADSGMDPERTLFIDDNAANVTTAREMGFSVYMPAAREDFRFLFDGILPESK